MKNNKFRQSQNKRYILIQKTDFSETKEIQFY